MQITHRDRVQKATANLFLQSKGSCDRYFSETWSSEKKVACRRVKTTAVERQRQLVPIGMAKKSSGDTTYFEQSRKYTEVAITGGGAANS